MTTNTNNWTRDEIELTRRAWQMLDHDNYTRSQARFAAVSWVVSLATIGVIAWVLL